MSGPASGATDQETAYAKLNLALHVRERLPDGYHRIETVFAFLDRGDLLSVQADSAINLSIGGPFAKGLSETDNLVLRAAQRLAHLSGISRGAQICLDKRLPVASGIGGGSADAAATLRLLNRFWQLDYTQAELAEIAKPLGADVPGCVYSRTARGTGIGHDLDFMPDKDLRPYTVLLVNPMIQVSTADIFTAWDGVDHGGLKRGEAMAIAKNGRNDLQKPAVGLVPQVADVLKMLEKFQPELARMSGSGATCFALFDTLAKAEEAEQYCQKTMDGVWTMIGSFR